MYMVRVVSQADAVTSLFGQSQDSTAPSAGSALLTWLGAFLAASLASSLTVALLGHGGQATRDVPVWVVAISATAMWLVFIGFVTRYSVKHGSGSPARDYRMSFVSADLWGIPLGIASQILLVNAVNYPLSRIWPTQFASSKVESRAKDLFHTAPGAWIVVLIFVVVIAAPFIEELVYRGLVQQGVGASIDKRVALLATAVLFAAIHLQPVEFPGLFAFAVVLGICQYRTGRLGLGIVTHMAFNATGLVLVAHLR